MYVRVRPRRRVLPNDRQSDGWDNLVMRGIDGGEDGRLGPLTYIGSGLHFALHSHHGKHNNDWNAHPLLVAMSLVQGHHHSQSASHLSGEGDVVNTSVD